VRLPNHRTLRLTVFLLGLVGLVIAFRRAVGESRGQALPDAQSLAVAGVLIMASMLMAGRGWTRLFDERHDRRALALSLYASQLTKYLPAGGFVQAAGQVSMSVTAGTGVGHAAAATAVWAFTVVVAGCMLAPGLVFAASLPVWLRALSLFGLLAPALLHRRALAAGLHLAHRIIGRVPDPDVLPSQRSLLVSFALAVGNALTGSAAFAVLLRSPGIDADRVTVMSAFALSWVVGFLVFPLPGGIGVREAVLVAIVPGASAAALLGAALAQRLLVLLSEVVATVGSQVAVARNRRARLVAVAPGAAASGDGAAAATTAPTDDARDEDVATSPAGDAT
jgi:hypothetical protein